MLVYIDWENHEVLGEEDYMDHIYEESEKLLADNAMLGDIADNYDIPIWKMLNSSDDSEQESVCEALREAAEEYAEQDSNFEAYDIE